MNLLIYCSGGFGREVMDIARRLNKKHCRWETIEFLDDVREEPFFYGAAVHKFDGAVKRFDTGSVEVAVANGEPFARKALGDKIEAAGIKLATLIDDTAVISETACIGAGAIIFPFCFVSSNAVIGGNSAIIAGSIIGHDVILGSNSVIGGLVNVGGFCSIGCESYVGMGVQIRDRTKIGSGSIVGMGSIVFKDIPDDVVALGNPCRPMRRNDEKKVFG